MFRTAALAFAAPVLAFAAPAALAPALAGPAAAEPWEMRRDDASVTFSLRHEGHDTVEGRFARFDAEIDFDPEAEATSSVSFTIDAASIDTDWATRDAFIRSPALLDVEEYPRITFISRAVRMISDAEAAVIGLVTMKGVTRQEVFDVAMTRAPGGADGAASFVVTGEIDRSEYGIGAFAPAVATKMALRVDLTAVPKGRE